TCLCARRLGTRQVPSLQRQSKWATELQSRELWLEAAYRANVDVTTALIIDLADCYRHLKQRGQEVDLMRKASGSGLFSIGRRCRRRNRSDEEGCGILRQFSPISGTACSLTVQIWPKRRRIERS